MKATNAAAEAVVLRTLTRRDAGMLPLVARIVRKGQLAIRYMAGLPMPLRTEDRRVLEAVIFPFYRDNARFHRVLFVGCDWYTMHYGRTFFRGRDYWTIDPAPRVRRFAGKQHIQAPIQQLDDFFPEQRFDLIVCNGVFGVGLDARADIERAFALCHSRLRPGGHFLLGWNDIPERRPMPLEEIEALRAFDRFAFPALGTAHYVTQTPYRHTYDFFVR